MKKHKSSFKWRHFEPTIILLCVRWYCRCHAPEIKKRMRPHLKMSGTTYRLDETHAEVA